LFNGQNYQPLPVENVRAFFSYVPQSASLLHRSIFEDIANIAFGKANLTQLRRRFVKQPKSVYAMNLLLS